MTNATAILPNGHEFWLALDITEAQASGVLVLVITSSISAFAVLSLLTVLLVSAWNTRKVDNPNLFVRSHAAAYLISLLLCDLLQAVGSIMNAKWYINRAVEFEPFCEAQGAVKQIADVGTALWSFTIAWHTFWVLFLRFQSRRSVMIALLVALWAAIGTLVIAGPAALDTKKNGPFYAITGYWCWISEEYSISRYTLDYMFMFASAFLSFVLYSLVYFKLRGNIVTVGSRMRFRMHRSNDTSRGLAADSQIVSVAKTMLLYPVAYTIIILPIAVCRFMDWSGRPIPFAATIFSDVVYLLSGTINVLLFFLTRRVLPRHSVITKRFSPETEEVGRFSFIGQTAEDTREKTDRESTVGLTNEKGVNMFQRVDSPDSYPYQRDDHSIVSFPEPRMDGLDSYPYQQDHNSNVSFPEPQMDYQQAYAPQQVSPEYEPQQPHEESVYDTHTESSVDVHEPAERMEDEDYFDVVENYRTESFSGPRKAPPPPLSSSRFSDTWEEPTGLTPHSARVEFPASTASPMRYPQSGVPHEEMSPGGRNPPLKSAFRDSGVFSPVPF
ncbi:hypothetical protein BDW22DRAFT_1482756 [Trametopsis cervina]|nr:hypothetical protein BDW22DRAFT_1482756 [Trametopsis cervina]